MVLISSVFVWQLADVSERQVRKTGKSSSSKHHATFSTRLQHNNTPGLVLEARTRGGGLTMSSGIQDGDAEEETHTQTLMQEGVHLPTESQRARGCARGAISKPQCKTVSQTVWTPSP